MDDSLCTYVTKRATEGPCETCGWSSKAAHEGWERTETVCSAYLGPVLTRCGHGEGEHMSYDRWVDCDFGKERPVAGQEWHAFTKEPT